MSSLVWGFLPLHSLFSLTQNLPKPLIRISSPDSRVCFIISRRVSMVVLDNFFGSLLLPESFEEKIALIL
jgi:hypothetical protein